MLSENQFTEPTEGFWRKFPWTRKNGSRAPIRDRVFNADLKSAASAVLSHDSAAPVVSAPASVAAPTKAVALATVAPTATPIATAHVSALPSVVEPVEPFHLGPEVFAVKPDREDSQIAIALLSARTLEEKDFASALGLLLEKTRAKAVAFLMPDEIEGVYRVSAHRGLDELTERSFIIGFRDNYLAEELDFQVIQYTENIKNSFHYRKRFSSNFLTDNPVAVFFHFPTLDTSCYCACFYSTLEESQEIDRQWALPFLNSIYPAILKFSHARLNPEAETEDPTMKFSKLFKRYSHSGKDSFFVTHAKFSDSAALSTDHSFLARFQEFCTSHPFADRVLILSPSHSLILHSQENIDQGRFLLRNLALEWGMEIEFATLQYPTDESNLFNLMLG